jgi:Carboxypeptidase regulatory-like domain
MRLFITTSLLASILANFSFLQAQVLYGTLLGTVMDASGAAVPSGKVLASNSGTGQIRETQTDERGFYAFRDLQAGTYTVRITADGFAPNEKSGVIVSINTAVRLDWRMDLANVSETISVAASAGLLQTDRADVHADITTKQITNLPLTGYRNYLSLLEMVPGATPTRFQNAQIDSPQRSLTPNINGTSRNSNNTRIDGATSVFPYLPHHRLYVPPVESIEFRCRAGHGRRSGDQRHYENRDERLARCPVRVS